MAKIFIVEDDTSTARVYQKAFEIANHKVEIATDGEEALDRLKTMKSKPAAILLDMMLPKVGGLEVVEKIKSGEEWAECRDIPVLILTNLPRLTIAEEIEKAIKLGAIGYMLKSMYDPTEVVKKVEEIIAQSKSS